MKDIIELVAPSIMLASWSMNPMPIAYEIDVDYKLIGS